MTSPREIRTLALREFHRAHGARFVETLGWTVPADYGDPGAEFAAIRSASALCDRSARSRFIIVGTDAADTLEAVVQGQPGEIEEGRARRCAVVDTEGRVRDIVLVVRTGGISYTVIGEPGQRFETLARLQTAAGGAGLEARVEDRTETTCLLAITGPEAERIVREHLAESLPSRLPAMHCALFEAHGYRALAIRASDTGEDGFEFVVAPQVGEHLAETLAGAGVALAGLQAQEVARLEACIPAFEPDLAPGLTPAEADIDVLLGIPGGAQGRILGALLLDSEAAVPPGTPVLARGEPVGEIRSCARSPRLDATVALAILDTRYALPGASLSVAGHSAGVAAKPLYRRRQRT